MRLRNKPTTSYVDGSQNDDDPSPVKRRRQSSRIVSDSSSGSDPEAERSDDSDVEMTTPKKRAATRHRAAATVGSTMFMDNREARAVANEGIYDSGSDVDDFIDDDGESEDESGSSDDSDGPTEASESQATENMTATQIVSQDEQDEENDSTEASGESDDSEAEPSKDAHCASFLNISDSGSDSDEADLDEKVTPAKKKIRTPSSGSTRKVVLSDSDEECTQPVVEAAEPSGTPSRKKRKRRRILRRIKIVPDSQEMDDEGCDDQGSTDDSGSEESDDDMSDFIVSDTEEIVGEDGQKPLFYPQEEREVTNLTNRQAWLLVIECMVNCCKKPNFFQSKDFLANRSLKTAYQKTFDTLNALTSDMRSNAWRERFRELLEYPDVHHGKISNISGESCMACNLSNRYASFNMVFSGRKYDFTTLQDLPEEETALSRRDRMLNVGKYCYERSASYHDMIHFKKQLLQSCAEKIKTLGLEGASEEVIVDGILKEEDWLDMHLRSLISLCNIAQNIIQKRSMISETDAVLTLS